jgi:predicted phosphodiesterase
MIDLGIQAGRLLVFGGPYSNLAATAAMRREAERLDIPRERVICTGDLVAYCAEPAQTVDLVRDWGIHVVMGNCEEALAFNGPDCGCGFESGSQCSLLAVTWYRYADRRVDGEQRRWMRSLPRSIDFEFRGRRFRVLHGSPASINEFVFASGDADARRAQVRQAGVDAIVGGHSGIPFGQRLGEAYWLNAGVIGMPANDGANRVWYMLIEPGTDGLVCSWQRLAYDYESSRRSTIEAGMTEYGEALASGLWPSMDILPEAERAQRGKPIDLPVLHIPAAPARQFNRRQAFAT